MPAAAVPMARCLLYKNRAMKKILKKSKVLLLTAALVLCAHAGASAQPLLGDLQPEQVKHPYIIKLINDTASAQGGFDVAFSKWKSKFFEKIYKYTDKAVEGREWTSEEKIETAFTAESLLVEILKDGDVTLLTHINGFTSKPVPLTLDGWAKRLLSGDHGLPAVMIADALARLVAYLVVYEGYNRLPPDPVTVPTELEPIPPVMSYRSEGPVVIRDLIPQSWIKDVDRRKKELGRIQPWVLQDRIIKKIGTDFEKRPLLVRALHNMRRILWRAVGRKGMSYSKAQNAVNNLIAIDSALDLADVIIETSLQGRTDDMIELLPKKLSTGEWIRWVSSHYESGYPMENPAKLFDFRVEEYLGPHPYYKHLRRFRRYAKPREELWVFGTRTYKKHSKELLQRHRELEDAIKRGELPIELPFMRLTRDGRVLLVRSPDDFGIYAEVDKDGHVRWIENKEKWENEYNFQRISLEMITKRNPEFLKGLFNMFGTGERCVISLMPDTGRWSVRLPDKMIEREIIEKAPRLPFIP